MNKKVISGILVILILLFTLSSTANAAASAKVFTNGNSGYYHNCGVYAVDGLMCIRDRYTTLSSKSINSSFGKVFNTSET